MSTTTFEVMYPRDEAAEIVHLHPRTLTQKAADGEIDSIRVGNKNLYPESAIKAFLAKGASKGTPKPTRNPRSTRSPKRRASK